MRRRKFVKQSILAGSSLALLSTGCTCKMDTEFLILGGGLSGLHMANLLQKAGKDYIVLEGSDRVGGRMFFHPDINKDVGGRGIGNMYKEVMQLVEQFNVELTDITPFVNSGQAFYIDGKLIPTWEDNLTNPSKLAYTTSPSPKELTALDEWYKRPELDESYGDMLTNLGRTKSELDLINISSNYNDIFTTSAINAYHSTAFRTFNGSSKIYNFEGGTKMFINSIVNSLTSPIHTRKFITEIKNTDSCCTVTCSDATSYCAPTVISTLPFSTLRDVKCDVPFNANQNKAIQNLAYTNITQIHFKAAEPYWLNDEMPASMWTDTPLERIMTMGFGEDNRDLVCWVNGKGTDFIDKMSDNELKNYTIKTLQKIRPSTEGKIEYVGAHSWGQYKYNKGAYAEFQVGQASLFEDMIKPAGNVYFAGEHTAKKSRGIEGAAESARQVFDLLKMNKKIEA